MEKKREIPANNIDGIKKAGEIIIKGGEAVGSSQFNRSLMLPISILVAAVLISGSIIYTRNGKVDPGQGKSAAKINVKFDDSDPTLGDKNAKVTIIEFSDFQCPFCRSFWGGSLSQIKTQYIDTGKARLVYKQFPLTDIHPGAKVAAEASLCAFEQGKFWEFHDKVFGEQGKNGQGTVAFSATDIKRWAAAISLKSLTDFNKCLDSGKYANKVTSDASYGLSLGVNGTPTFFINGQVVVGAQPFAVFQGVIESALKK